MSRGKGASDKKKSSKQRGNGRGTVWALPNGRYRWQITLGYRANGKRLSASGTAKDRTAAELALAKAIADHARGLLAAPERLTVRTYAERWLERRKHRATATRRVYATELAYALEHLGHLHLRAVRTHHLRDTLLLLSDRVMSTGLGRNRLMSSRTLAAVRTRLRSLFTEAVTDGLIVVNPCDAVKRVKVARTEHPGVALDFPQVARLHQLGEALHRADSLRLWPAIFTAVSVGLRRGEVMGLRWCDVDFENDILHVVQNLTNPTGGLEVRPTKTESGSRDVLMPASLKAALERQREAMRAECERRGEIMRAHLPVFPTALGKYTSPENLGRALRCLIEWSDHECRIERTKKTTNRDDTRPLTLENKLRGVAAEHRPHLEAVIRAGAVLPLISPHDLRHTAGTLMLRRGVPIEVVSRTLGHADIALTYRVYRHVLESERRQHVVDLFEPPVPERPARSVPLN